MICWFFPEEDLLLMIKWIIQSTNYYMDNDNILRSLISIDPQLPESYLIITSPWPLNTFQDFLIHLFVITTTSMPSQLTIVFQGLVCLFGTAYNLRDLSPSCRIGGSPRSCAGKKSEAKKHCNPYQYPYIKLSNA